MTGIRRQITEIGKTTAFSSAFLRAPSLLLLALGALLFGVSHSVQAQQRKIPRIGFLLAVSASTSADRVNEFRQGLRELGYAEGSNVLVEYRYAEGDLARLAALAVELVDRKVDIIVTAGGQATRAARKATSTIPIIMTNDPDPVGSGFVASLGRPGGNITGLSTLAPELNGKRLELLKEVLPKSSRVAVIGTSTQEGHAQAIKGLELAARALNVQIQYLDVLDSEAVEIAFRTAARSRADGIITLTSPLLRSHRVQLADLALKNHIPLYTTTYSL